MIVLKDEPELRHVIAHLFEAIRMAGKGDEAACWYELKSIEGLILFDGDDDYQEYVNDLQRSKQGNASKTSET